MEEDRGTLGEMVHAVHWKGLKARSKELVLLGQVSHGCCLSQVLQVCSGSEKIHQITTQYILWGSMKSVHVSKSRTLCVYIQISDGREEEIYSGLETAAMGEIRKERPE